MSIAAELVQERARRGRPPAPSRGGGPGVLCTIAAKRGSAPRGVGTWMLVRPDGTVLGTIGGGAVEHLAVQEAKALWAHGGGPVRRHYDLTPGAAELGMVCGGDIRRGIWRCANERDHPVSSEQLSPLQAGPPASGGAAGGASRVAGHPPPNGRRGGGARLCRYL
ncbi:MAG: XdhC family protein [Flavonifractor plautii]